MPNKAEGDTGKAPETSRREVLQKAGVDEPDMPSCEALYLVGYLFEIGPVSNGGAVSHGEIEAWQANTGVPLQSWEARVLRRLSVDYLNEAHKATARDCPPPWSEAPVPNLNAERVRDSLRALAAL